jgi:hypothetical protein
LPKDLPTTVALARRVGHHADDRSAPATSRRFWLAHVSPGGVRMRTGFVDDDELARPDLDEVLGALAAGSFPPWGTITDDPLLLVCTNSRRDVCCALAGRPVADALAADAAYAPFVMESSHLGGHRFAPTALLLPSGHAFGRLDAEAAKTVLARARHGRLGALSHHRGRTSLSRPGQAAEHEVRRTQGVDGLDALDVLRVLDGRAVPAPLRWEGADGAAVTEVRHRDGRAWRVPVRQVTLDEERSESCGKAPAPVDTWVADQPVAVQPWAVTGRSPAVG